MKTDPSDEQTWETLCDRCGLCCFEKIEAENGTIFFTQTPCRYLDVETRQCKIYDRRFVINPECVKLTPELVREIRWLHDECGYMRAFGLKNRVRGKHPQRQDAPQSGDKNTRSKRHVT